MQQTRPKRGLAGVVLAVILAIAWIGNDMPGSNAVAFVLAIAFIGFVLFAASVNTRRQ